MAGSKTLVRTCLTVAICQFIGTAPGRAASINVSGSLDNGENCTLREALKNINTGVVQGDDGCTVIGLLGIDDTVTFSVDSVSGLSSPLTIYDGSVNISSSSELVTIEGDGQSSVFNITSSTVSFNSIAITGGSAEFGGGLHITGGSDVVLNHTIVTNNTASSQGAGIFINEASTITLTNSTVTDNIASEATQEGGGVAANSSVVNVHSSQIAHNSAGIGGGIFAGNNSTVSLSYSQVSSNSATQTTGGGGIRIGGGTTLDIERSLIVGNEASHSGGGLRIAGTMTMRNSTISNNVANSDDNAFAGGMYAASGTVTLVNNTISSNSSSGAAGGVFLINADVNLYNNIVAGNRGLYTLDIDEVFSGGGGLINSSHNIFGDSARTSSEAFGGEFWPSMNDIVATSDGPSPSVLSSILHPLQSNSGFTQTHGLATNSVAIDAGEPTFCTNYLIETDQRGVPRNDDYCDIGSFEFIEAESDEDEFCFVAVTTDKKAITLCL